MCSVQDLETLRGSMRLILSALRKKVMVRCRTRRPQIVSGPAAQSELCVTLAPALFIVVDHLQLFL